MFEGAQNLSHTPILFNIFNAFVSTLLKSYLNICHLSAL